MYVVLSDSTNEAVGIHNAVQILGTYLLRDEAVQATDKLFSETIDSYHEESMDYSDAAPVSTKNYDQFTGAEIEPYPEYVVGEAIGDGKEYHIYFMAVHCRYDAALEP